MKPRALAAAALLLLPAGCAVGPDFKRPSAPDVSTYGSTPPSTTSATDRVPGGEAQRFVEGLDIPGEWWVLFHSQPLNDLIKRSLESNPDVKAGQAALAAARENVVAQRAAFFPAVAGSVATTRHRTPNLISPFVTQSTAEGSAYYTYHTPQVTVSYAPDVFGLTRRSVEAAEAQAEQARFQLLATQITLTANVVGAAIQEASLRAQIEATRELIAINGEILKLQRRRLELGDIAKLDVAMQEMQSAQIAATLPALLKQLAQQRHLLAVLAGGFPSEEMPERFELSSLRLPQELPLSLPAQLVEQRPDVRQAEESLHAASARIGIAVANRFPNLALTADVGRLAVAIGQMSAAGAFWDLGATAAQVIFQGGALSAQERGARAAYVQATEQYRSTVLGAFQNVADTLSALEQDADALKAAAAAADGAKTVLDMTTHQLRLGSVSQLALLGAQQAYRQSVIALAQAKANRYADTAALFQALGGGWWNREPQPAQ